MGSSQKVLLTRSAARSLPVRTAIMTAPAAIGLAMALVTRTAPLRKRMRTVAIVLLVVGGVTVWASAASAQSTPGQGPGGPVLVVTDSGDAFGTYYAEILRAEGLNEFAVTDKANLSAATLADHQVVLLAQTSLSDAQAAVLTTWVQAGGNLIAMRPDARLAGLLGLGAATGNLTDGYLKVATASPPGAGITSDTMQIHGTADRWSIADATTVATLYSDADSATSAPAVTLRGVGTAGGQAAAFTYDLARSVVGTRQGNLAWAGQKRDGEIDPIRSDDLFFPNWLDMSKVAIPQADEQQRLLANLITQMNLDRTPLPRFWYLPRGEKAAVVMSGDDHGNGGTAGQFEHFKADSPAGCSVADWRCVRSTSYVYPNTPITDAQAAAYEAAGFEIALHLSTGCSNFTPDSLADDWTSQLPEFASSWPSLAAPRTSRTHCIAWSDWASEPKVELQHGVRLDTNYYYWPAAWVQDRPGMFTGSGFPMRFADRDGSLIDVYQAATQLTDESGIDIDRHIKALLDGALGPDGYYGVFTANMHTDEPDHPGADAIVAAAQARGVPVVSAVQMLDWLDGRNDSSFQDLSYAGGQLRFTVQPGDGSRGLEAMVPVTAGTGELAQLTRNGTQVPVTRRTVKGIDYRVFDAAAGDYVATYGPGDETPPETTITDATVAGDSARLTFSSNEAGARFECRLDGGPFDVCASPTEYSGLGDGSHTFTARAIDLAGNVDPTPATRGFVTAGTPSGDTTPPETTITDATVVGDHARLTFSSNDAGARFECRLDGEAFAACTSPAEYSGLGDGSHTFRVRAIDLAGNVDLTPASRVFATAATTSGTATTSPGGVPPTPGGGEAPAPGATAALDRSAPRVTIVKRTVRVSAKGMVTLRVTCPRTEVTCRVDLRLRRGGRQLARRTLTVAGGKTSNITLRLTESGRASLARLRTLMVEAAATARDPAGNHTTTTTRIRLLAPPRR